MYGIVWLMIVKQKYVVWYLHFHKVLKEKACHWLVKDRSSLTFWTWQEYDESLCKPAGVEADD